MWIYLVLGIVAGGVSVEVYNGTRNIHLAVASYLFQVSLLILSIIKENK